MHVTRTASPRSVYASILLAQVSLSHHQTHGHFCGWLEAPEGCLWGAMAAARHFLGAVWVSSCLLKSWEALSKHQESPNRAQMTKSQCILHRARLFEALWALHGVIGWVKDSSLIDPLMWWALRQHNFEVLRLCQSSTCPLYQRFAASIPPPTTSRSGLNQGV